MTLLDGFNYYKEYSDSDWQFTLKVERDAGSVLKLISIYDDRPTSEALAGASALLVEIEKWKAMGLRHRMGNAEQNSQRCVWNAFREALSADNDYGAIISIMQLKGFGSYRDEESGQRRAKLATAVLRFLKPADWGVVDWRTIAMLGLLRKTNGNVDQALTLASKKRFANLRELLDIVDEEGACEVNRQYRGMRNASLARAVDVEMAIFGLSLMAWSMP
jgi:aminopeptidase N